MQKHDAPRFAAAMTACSEYYGRTLSDPIIEIYWRGLEVFDIQAVEVAFQAHIRNPDTGQFFPKVGDIVKLIEGATGDRAQVAWSKVHFAVRCIGPYQSLVFDDPIIHLVLTDMGGFGQLCNVRTDDMPFRAKEFEQRYRAYAVRPQLPDYLPRLVGETEANNRNGGYLEHIPEPVVIGDTTKAQAVLAGGKEGISLVSKPIAALIQKAVNHEPSAA